MLGSIFLIVAGIAIAGDWPHSAGFAIGLGAGIVAGFDLWRVIPLNRR